MKPMKIGHAVLLGTFKQDSPEWHEARGGMIGGSDIASVLGLSSWKSAFTLWHEKFGTVPPQIRDDNARRKQAYGHHMEPFIAAEFASRHPELSVFETGTWQNIERPWQGCNPDRLLVLGDRDVSDAHSLLQIKTANFATDWADGIPAGYLAQIKWELDTFGFPKGWLAVYFNVSGDYQEFLVEADDFEADAVRARALAFFNAEEPPAIDGSASTYETLRRLNPSITPKEEAEIPEDVAVRYLDGLRAAKAATAEITKWKGHLLAHMGTAQYAVYDGRKIASRAAIKDGVPYLKEA